MSSPIAHAVEKALGNHAANGAAFERGIAVAADPALKPGSLDGVIGQNGQTYDHLAPEPNAEAEKQSESAWNKIDVHFDPSAGEALRINVRRLGTVATAQDAVVLPVSAEVAA